MWRIYDVSLGAEISSADNVELHLAMDHAVERDGLTWRSSSGKRWFCIWRNQVSRMYLAWLINMGNISRRYGKELPAKYITDRSIWGARNAASVTRLGWDTYRTAWGLSRRCVSTSREKEYGDSEIEGAINDLKAHHYIDDYEYALAFYRNSLRSLGRYESQTWTRAEGRRCS